VIRQNVFFKRALGAFFYKPTLDAIELLTSPGTNLLKEAGVEGI